jgi:hypothetical protein
MLMLDAKYCKNQKPIVKKKKLNILIPNILQRTIRVPTTT